MFDRLFKVGTVIALFVIAGSMFASAMAGTPEDQASAATAAQWAIGWGYEHGNNGLPKDYTKALEYYFKSAEKGYPPAQDSIGQMYYYGRGVGQDYKTAVSWTRKAADQGNATAQANLANMYADGYGVIQDFAKAADLFQKSADQGNMMGQWGLAVAYFEGRGVSKDYQRAYFWLILAKAEMPSEVMTVADNMGAILASKLTASQLAEMQRLAREWKAK